MITFLANDLIIRIANKGIYICFYSFAELEHLVVCGHVAICLRGLFCFKERFVKVISLWIVFVKVKIVKCNLENKGHEFFHFGDLDHKQLLIHRWLLGNLFLFWFVFIQGTWLYWWPLVHQIAWKKEYLPIRVVEGAYVLIYVSILLFSRSLHWLIFHGFRW